VDKVHQNTVGAREAAFALNNLCNSMEGYIKVEASNRYSEVYADKSRITRNVNKIAEMLSPRIAQTADHSFEVWLAMDIITFNSGDKTALEIRNSVIEGYKNDVLDVDFTSEKDAHIIAEKFKPNERKQIFEPLLKVLDNEAIHVSITNYEKTIPLRTRIKSARVFKEIIIPPVTLEELQAEQERKNKIYSMVVNLKEGQDVLKIGKKQIMENLLFVEEKGQTPFDIISPVEVGDFSLKIKMPIRCELKVEDNGHLELFNSKLDIYAEGNELPELTYSIKEQIKYLFDLYQQNHDNADSRIVELKKYL
jgi:hypothetical protein